MQIDPPNRGEQVEALYRSTRWLIRQIALREGLNKEERVCFEWTLRVWLHRFAKRACNDPWRAEGMWKGLLSIAFRFGASFKGIEIPKEDPEEEQEQEEKPRLRLIKPEEGSGTESEDGGSEGKREPEKGIN